MNEFKTKLNPFIPIGRLAISIVVFGLICFLINRVLFENKTHEVEKYIGFLLLALFFLLLIQIYLKEFITKTKSYIITGQLIKEYNFLTKKTKIIKKEDIKGFSRSKIPYQIWNFKQIIIYLKDGSKIDLMQFAYFNFEQIEPFLIENKYRFFGYEPYNWKWFNSRVYTFDEK